MSRSFIELVASKQYWEKVMSHLQTRVTGSSCGTWYPLRHSAGQVDPTVAVPGIEMHTGKMTVVEATEFFVNEGYQVRPWQRSRPSAVHSTLKQ